MAWQLIYTSAPRSLEAGRSGFGTVARHRALSPLLVSAIERTSQFSRLPGVDTDRVIFSHRIVTVAGSRFHVLSSIRDAGADYTGRTNHIAHHLIVDPREIAQLGAGGPSPADVLLAMTWATSWPEHPRYLEAADEVALATLHARTTGTAWQRITGDPNQAGLLATGDASRGAYIIQPPGVDLREVFAESLRLMPERLWQISFTTSLQPSDESADFRWIGIEERSPLRAQSESSGRPVLNLASPGTLPLVEVAQPAAASPVQQSFAPTSPISSPSSDEGRTDWPTATSVTTQRPTHPPIERGVEWPSTSTPATMRSNRKWWLLAGAMSIIVAAASVAFFVGRPIYTKYKHRKEVSAEIDSILNRSGYFSNTVHVELKSAEPVDLGKELAEAADRSWQVARKADFAAMLRLPDRALIERARSANLNIPTEINALDQRLEKIAGIYQWLRDFQPQPEDDKALEEITKRRSEADQLTSPTPKTNAFDKIKGVIDQLADQQRVQVDKQRAQMVLSLLKNVPIKRPHPDQKIDWFEKALRPIAPASEDEETKLILKAAHQLIDDWKFVDAQEPTKVLTELEQRIAQRSDWPSWLKAKAQGKITVARTGKAPAPNEPIPPTVPNAPKFSSLTVKPASPRPVFYFFTDNTSLSYPIPAGGEPFKLMLRIAGQKEEEARPYNARESFGPDGDYFKNQGGKLISGTKPPPLPYRLILKRGDAEIARIFVGQPPSDEDCLENLNIELTLKQDGQIGGTLPELAPPGDVSFILRNVGDIDGTRNIYTLEVDSKGKCNYEPLKKELLRQSGLLRKEKAKLQANKQSNATAKPPKITAKEVGEIAMQIAALEYPEKGKKNKKYKPFLSLSSLGKSLSETPQDKTATIIENSKALQAEAIKFQGQFHDDKNLSNIVMQCMKLNSAQGDTDAIAARQLSLAKEAQFIAGELARIDAELARLDALPPLKDNKLPLGDYTLFINPSVIGLKPIKLRALRVQ